MVTPPLPTSRLLPRSSSRVALLRGGGRHAAVVWEQIAPHYDEVLVWDDSTDDAALHPLLLDLPRFDRTASMNFKLLDCFVAVGCPSTRKKLVASVDQAFPETNEDVSVAFPTIVHQTAVIAGTATIGRGGFIGPHAVVNTAARVGNFCLINTAALIEHDCVLRDYATLNPGAMVLGSVVVEASAVLGANSTVRERRTIMEQAVVGMGAAVVRDINGPLYGFWGGVPARPISKATDSASGNRIPWCFRKSFSMERIHLYLRPSLEKGHLTNDGPLQSVLQSKVKTLVRSNRQVLLTSSGTSALHALAAGLDLRHGRHLKWVTQAFTFPSSIQGPMADALVCDIDAEWLGPCRKFLQERQADYDGIIVSNVFGFQTEILRYEEFCVDHNKFLIFDNAATPLGFVEDGRCIHDVGDGAIVSFHETKPYGRGEGGAVFAGKDIAPFVHQAMNFGYDIPNQVRVPNRYSSNWRMSDIAAAAICDHIDNVISEKWESKLNALARFAIEEMGKRRYETAFPVRYPTILSCLFVDLKDGEPGAATCRRFNSHGTEAKQYYCPLVGRSEAPKAWQLFDRTVCLPFHLGVSRDDIVGMLDQLPKKGIA